MTWPIRFIPGRLVGDPWKHSDPAVRLRVVTETHDPRILPFLPELALKDQDPEVRLAALLRADDEALWMDRSRKDPTERIRSVAEQQLQRIACRRTTDPEVRQRRIDWLQQNASVHARQYVAQHAALPGLRIEAIALITAQGFLGDRVVADTDLKVAAAALTRIDQISTLERIAGELRTKNKAKFQAVQRRLAEISDDAAKIVEGEALSLCKAMERLLRGETDGDRNTRLAQLEARWRKLAAAPDEALARRFTGAAEIIRQAIAQPAPAAADDHADDVALLQALLQAEDPTTARQELKQLIRSLPYQRYLELTEWIARVELHLGSLDARPHPELSRLATEIQAAAKAAGKHPRTDRVMALVSAWDRAWSQTPSPTAADDALKEQVMRTFADLRKRMDAAQVAASAPHIDLDAIEQALTDGRLADAQPALLKARAQLQRRDARGQRPSASVNVRLNLLFDRLKEMRDWQHWSNNKVRKQLISEIEALPGAGLHPDAITAKLKDARKQWQQLDHMERLPGDKHPRGASAADWRRFHAACTQAFETAEPFLEKRKAKQEQKEQEVTRWLHQAMEAAIDDHPEPGALQHHIKRARLEIRCVDELPATVRGKIANRLRRLMDALNERLNAHWNAVESVKQQLIQEARQLANEQDHRAALDKAKALQRQWQAAGSTRRRREQALWEAFREPIDPLFEQATAARREAAAAEQEAKAGVEALCRQAEALAKAPAAELDQAARELAGLAQRWRQTRVREPALQKRFVRAEEALAQRQADAAAADVLAALDAVTRRCDLIQQAWTASAGGTLDADQAEQLRAAWPPARAAFIEDELEDRLEALLAAADTADRSWTDTGNNEQVAGQILIEMEFLAGLPSPEDQRQARMDYQVRRLSQRLGGGERVALEDEIHALIQRWQLCWPLPAGSVGGLRARYEETIKTLKKSITK